MIEARLQSVRDRVAAACARAGRNPDDVTLVAVSKGHPKEMIIAAHAAGQSIFGESRAQELAEKCQALPSGIEWHFIGPLQRNKVRRVRPVTALLHSLDRAGLAEAWVKGPGPAPPVLIQVRMGGESTKHGFEPSETKEAALAAAELGLTVRGLMTIPPPVADPNEARPWFVLLRELRDELVGSGLESATELSMGMSGDFEVAVEEGATLIRVGSAIFGERKSY